MAEATSETFMDMGPGKVPGQRQLIFIKGTTAAGGDTITVPGITTIDAAFLVAPADGTVGTFTSIVGNVITVSSAAKAYAGWCVGV